MDKLNRFNKDGKDYFCFIEVKDTLFPTIPKTTVKSWLRQLKIMCKRCTEEEHKFFKNAMPFLSGAFGTIDQDDLEKLLEFSRYKKNEIDRTTGNYACSTSQLHVMSAPLSRDNSNPSKLPAGETENISVTSLTAGNIDEDDVEKLLEPSRCKKNEKNEIDRTTGNYACTTSQSHVIPAPLSRDNSYPSKLLAGKTGNISVSSVTVNKSADVEDCIDNIATTVDSCLADNTPDTFSSKNLPTSTGTLDTTFLQPTTKTNQTADNTGISTAECNNQDGFYRTRYTIPSESISPQLQKELEGFKKFYTSDINPSRSGCKFTTTTMSKVYERVLCFFKFVNVSYPYQQLSLSLTSNLELVEEYVQHMTKSRKLMASTVSRNLSAIATVIKYACHHVSDIEKLPEIIAIRKMQRQLGREERITRKRKREGFSSNKSENLLFSYILDVIRQVRDQYYTTAGITSSRHLHDFVLLSLYTRALPGRGKELRTLRLIDRTGFETCFQADNEENLNALVFESDGSIILIETDFKTVKTIGPSKIDITDDKWLVYFIKVYTQKHRTTLLLGKTHDYFFMNKNGEPFLSSATISKYLSDLFDRETGIRASTNKMHHAICTYFMSLPESDNLKLRENLASLLKHSVRHQQETYNDQRRQEKVQLGRSFMQKRLLDSDLLDAEEIELETVKNSGRPVDPHDSSDEDLLPQAGELVALLDPASTRSNNAMIFIAKVI